MARASRAALPWLPAGALLLLFLLRVAGPAAVTPTHGFSAYFTAARLVREGADAARFYDDAWFWDQTVRLGFAGTEDIYNANPPVTALLLWPLSSLAPSTARVLWTTLNLLFLGLALAITLRALRAPPVAGALGLALLALAQPVRAEMQLGQAYALLLLGMAALLWAYLAGRDPAVGLILGLLLIGKTAGLLLPLLLLGQRRWRALGWTALTIAGVALLTLPLFGLTAWRAYIAALRSIGAQPWVAVTAYQDLPGLLAHLLRPDAQWNPQPLWAAPRLAAPLLALTALSLVAATGWATWRADPEARRDRALTFAAWLSLTLVLSPVSEDYHFTLLFVPLAILLLDWSAIRPGGPRTALLLLALILLTAPLPYTRPDLAAGAWALLAYPRLYGALALWAAALLALRRERAHQHRLPVPRWRDVDEEAANVASVWARRGIGGG
jgi:alpha-1,2-mannosyltransferase